MIMNQLVILLYASFLPQMVRGWPGPQVMFYVHGFMTMAAFVYIAVYIKETGNLTDREKKVIFAPLIYREKVKRQVDSGLCTTDFDEEELR